jgi:hypothetical protein
MHKKSSLGKMFRGSSMIFATVAAIFALSACGGNDTTGSTSAIDNTAGSANDEACNMSRERVEELASTIESGATGL